MYSSFASVYDLLMRDVDYAGWADFYAERLLERGVMAGAQVVECACGTGGLTIPLSRCFRMTGVDASEDMLNIAVRKARESGRDIRFVRQDMRKLKLHRAVDAVLCTCDGPNYLMTSKQLKDFFCAAHSALGAGGVVALDVSTEHKLQHVLGDNTLGKSDSDTCVLWQNEWEAARRRVHMQLDIFSRRDDGAYDRAVETQSQQAWRREELERSLSECGFEDIRVFGDVGNQAHTDTEHRIHITAVKTALEER